MLNNEDYMKIFHEIKNSVTLINSYLQLAEKKHPEIGEFDYWTNSISEVSRLRSIVTELSQIKLGDSLKTVALDLRDFITECCNDSHYFSENEEITCILSLPDEPLFVPIDAKQLHHAFTNLLKNSCEAMHHSGKILIHASRADEHVCVSITDFGGGIDKHLLDQVFDPFFTTKEEGSGLGLNITKQIIEAHNGIITIDSRPGDGCTFTILLPAHPTFDGE